MEILNFLDKLDYLMARDKLNKHTLSQRSGVPYTTIVGFYERSYENTKLSTIQKLADFFGVSLDYLMRDQHTNPYDAPNSLSADEVRLLDQYRGLSSAGKEYILQTISMAGQVYGQKNEE